MKSLSNLSNKAVSWFLCALMGVHIFIIFLSALNPSIWLDEAYTLSELGQPYGIMLGLLSTGDVHPPLYHIIAKAICGVVKAVLPSLPLIAVVKCISVLPMLLLVVVGFTKVRRNWGDLCGVLFSFCVVAMPKMLHYAVEARMYSWALLFITLSFLYAYDCAKQPAIIKNWVLLSVVSALAAWTHYFACLSAVFVYVVLGVWCFINDKKKLLRWLLSGMLVALLYLPHLIVLTRTFENVSKDFWIPEIGLLELTRLASFPFMFTRLTSFRGAAFGALLALLYVWICYSYFRDKVKPDFQRTYFAFAGAAIPVLTVAVGVIVSWLIRPFIIQRYIFATLGCCWLCFSILLTTPNRIRRSNAIITLTAALVLIGNLSCFVVDEVRYIQHTKTAYNMLQGMGDNDVIITDYNHISGVLDYVTGNRKIYRLRTVPGSEDSNFSKTIFPDTVLIDRYENVPEISDANVTVYAALDANEDRPADNLDDYIAASGNHATFIGEYEFDVYKFSLYRIEP